MTQQQGETRIETDSMGEMQVPAWALWGASTQRARENFPIAGRGVPVEIVHAFGHLKAACAAANRELDKLPAAIVDPIIAAANEVAAGKLDDHFVVDVYQTGSGTSTNMNANEVIANRANQIRGEHGGGGEGGAEKIHPNDHVNMGQSSNDTFPTAMHLAAALAIHHRLLLALERLRARLSEQARRWDEVVKIGRTHLMDATPIRVGQVFAGYEAQALYAERRALEAAERLQGSLAIGGTAVGTGINTHERFASLVCHELTARFQEQYPGAVFEEADNHVEAQATRDSFVEAHGHLKTIAVSLSKIANDIRWLGSGPRCGLGELRLPAIQPGSSIMPGKVNPVICESVMQVACRVVANDHAVTLGAFGGVGSLLELNVAMPMMADAGLESINLLAAACDVFVDKLLDGLEVDAERCRSLIEQSLMMVTSLAPEIGYDTAAKLAKEALEQGRTIRELVRERGLIDDTRLDALLDPASMTRPSEE
ncbi:MAG: class II fumarate hydratase [Phycisphaeraceae bacterium]